MTSPPFRPVSTIDLQTIVDLLRAEAKHHDLLAHLSEDRQDEAIDRAISKTLNHVINAIEAVTL